MITKSITCLVIKVITAENVLDKMKIIEILSEERKSCRGL